MRRVSGWAAIVLGVMAAGCAGSVREGRKPDATRAEANAIRVHLVGGIAADAALVEREAVRALRVVQRWGALSHPVTLRVHPTHEALEEAARQRDVPWMRGWARFDDVELEAPSSWGGDRAPENVAELLRHELTHVVMYQRVADRDSWTRVSIPLWFREGMASVTSQQGYRRMTGKELGSWLRDHPDDDPWMGAEHLPAGAQPVVYGAAHRAFERLLARAGDDGVHRILDALRTGESFDEAFVSSAGSRPAAFLGVFRLELERLALRGRPALPRPLVAAIPSLL